MTRIKFIHHLAIQFEASARELLETTNYKDALCRWKELRVLVAQLSVQTEYLENVIRIDYKRQTGVRAVRDLWKKLDTKILEAPYLPSLESEKFTMAENSLGAHIHTNYGN